MGTPYSAIYNYFLAKISDYSFANMTDATLTTSMRNHLQSAIVEFTDCTQDLSQRDDTNKTFNISLTDTEVEILCLYMVLSWMRGKFLDDKFLRPTLTDKDYNVYSQANQLREIVKARKEIKIELETLVGKYTYSGSNIDNLQNENSNANTYGVINYDPSWSEIGRDELYP